MFNNCIHISERLHRWAKPHSISDCYESYGHLKQDENIIISKMKGEVSWNASWAWTGVRIPWPRPPHGQNDPRPAPSPCNTTFIIFKAVGNFHMNGSRPPSSDPKGWVPLESFHTHTSSCCISSEDRSQWRAQEDVCVWKDSSVARKACYHSVKICALVALWHSQKEYSSKTEVPKRSWS